MTAKIDRRKLFRRLTWLFGSSATLGLSLWILVHHTSWGGPLVAGGLRAIIGTDNVAALEDFAYGIEDRFNRLSKRGEKPKAHWTVPEKPHLVPPTQAASGPSFPLFEPKSMGPVHKSWSAPGDGEWVVLEDPRKPERNPAMYKTLVHPDAHRSWAELFVVAIDLEQIDLHPVLGTREPIAEAKVPVDLSRPGKIPDEHLGALLAAFNGGFMAEHGHYGMSIGGVTLIKPRETSCTIVGYRDGTVEIATWKTIAHAEERMDWFRQTPACMYENDVMHVGLRRPETRLWGATLDGDTVIRRSAIGLDESRRILFVGISNHTTAQALATGMHHVGAVDVAQLDVNWSYPKFLIYKSGSERGLAATALADGFEYTAADYLTKPSLRDFFYLTRRAVPRTLKAAEKAALATPSAAPDAGKSPADPPKEGEAVADSKATTSSVGPCPNCPK